MSQGRLPAEVYWRRRLLLLAAVIGLVWLTLRLVGGGDDEPAAKPRPTETTATPKTATAKGPVSGTVAVTLVSARQPCDPEKIRMTPTVRPGQLAKEAVEIGLVVSSTEQTACTLDPGDADTVAVISANGTAIWDSTVCKKSLLDEPVSISPQWASLVTATWSGRVSGGACSAKEGFASPGTYAVQVGTLGGEPGKTTFSLERGPEPKPTKTANKPKPTKSTPKPKGTTKPND